MGKVEIINGVYYLILKGKKIRMSTVDEVDAWSRYFNKIHQDYINGKYNHIIDEILIKQKKGYYNNKINKVRSKQVVFVYCKNCDWTQDDFWSKDYNPIRSLLTWEEALFGDKIDTQFSKDSEFVARRGIITVRDIIAKDCERVAKTILKMKFRTREEYESLNPEHKCPKCGEHLVED
jgi:predicted nucleic-acid-binding Zn-ribbon protein